MAQRQRRGASAWAAYWYYQRGTRGKLPVQRLDAARTAPVRGRIEMNRRAQQGPAGADNVGHGACRVSNVDAVSPDERFRDPLTLRRRVKRHDASDCLPARDVNEAEVREVGNGTARCILHEAPYRRGRKRGLRWRR